MKTEYVNFGDMEQDTYFQFPKWFMKPKYNKIPMASKFVYMLILDTCKLSYSNYKSRAYEGNYFEFWDYIKDVPICKISYPVFMDKLGINSKNTISKHLDTLENLGLIERKRNFDNTSYYYVKRFSNEIEDVYISNSNLDKDKVIEIFKERQNKKADNQDK